METICLDKAVFDRLEQEVTDRAVEVSKELMASLKFALLLQLIPEEKRMEAIADIKEYRAEHWDGSLPVDEAYDKYMS